jgi:colanic acid biosynthesis glycosyl transferase WcaI
LGIGAEPVVLYAGNVGFSQSFDLILAAARALPGVTFLINGDGAMRAELQAAAAGLANVRFGDFVAPDRLGELLATGDLHVVPLRRGLAKVSVPSKTYSILAAGRPIVASVDPGTEVANLVERAGAGIAVPPDDPEAFTAAITRLIDAPDEAAHMGRAGRAYVEQWASPAAVAARYEALFAELRS